MTHDERVSGIQRLRDLSEALDETDAQLYLFFQLCPVVMAVTDRTYFRRVSKYMCDVLGYTETDLLAKPWASLLHPTDVSRAGALKRSLIRGTPAFTFQTKVRTKDGRYCLLDWTASPYTPAGLAYSVATIRGHLDEP